MMSAPPRSEMKRSVARSRTSYFADPALADPLEMRVGDPSGTNESNAKLLQDERMYRRPQIIRAGDSVIEADCWRARPKRASSVRQRRQRVHGCLGSGVERPIDGVVIVI